MVRLKEDEDTINFHERVLERSQGVKLLGLRKSPELNPKVTITRIENFTCPACKETLGEVVSINGKVRGWCGNTHSYVEEKI